MPDLEPRRARLGKILGSCEDFLAMSVGNPNSEEFNANNAESRAAGKFDNRASDENYVTDASNFIKETSLDRMIEMAEEARRKKLTEPPKWIIPDFPD